jgi:hypothetical protein
MKSDTKQWRMRLTSQRLGKEVLRLIPGQRSAAANRTAFGTVETSVLRVSVAMQFRISAGHKFSESGIRESFNAIRERDWNAKRN